MCALLLPTVRHRSLQASSQGIRRRGSARERGPPDRRMTGLPSRMLRSAYSGAAGNQPGDQRGPSQQGNQRAGFNNQREDHVVGRNRLVEAKQPDRQADHQRQDCPRDEPGRNQPGQRPRPDEERGGERNSGYRVDQEEWAVGRDELIALALPENPVDITNPSQQPNPAPASRSTRAVMNRLPRFLSSGLRTDA